MTVIDEYSRECLAILVVWNIGSDGVLDPLTDLFVEHGAPDHIRSDNGPEFAAKVVREWLMKLGVKTLFIKPGREEPGALAAHAGICAGLAG